jgi:hypothetical protein
LHFHLFFLFVFFLSYRSEVTLILYVIHLLSF